MHTVRHIVNKLLKPSRVLLSTHKPFELVFLICLGWQPLVQAEHDTRYRHNADCSLMSTLPLHTKTQLWHHSLIIPQRHERANSDMEIRPSLGYGWVILKHCSRSSDDLLLSTQPAPSVFVFDVRTVNFLWDTSELQSSRCVHHPAARKWLQDSLHITSHKLVLCVFTVDLPLMVRH